MGLAMFCGVAVSAQASSLQITDSFTTDLGNIVSPPNGFTRFAVFGADEGTTESTSFTFSLTKGQTFKFATAFLNVEGNSTSYIDTAELGYKGPDGTWHKLWHTDSKTATYTLGSWKK